MSSIKQTHPPPSPCVHVGSCRCCGCGSSSSSSHSTSSPSPSSPAPSSTCGHLPLPHLDILLTHRPPPSYAYTGGIPRHAHTLHPHREMNKYRFPKSFFHFFLIDNLIRVYLLANNYQIPNKLLANYNISTWEDKNSK